ncbi:MAG TPA: protein kinase [Pyrinomonadaceae bacterium]|nr:protein kinase [Pyrinomonadaceae bacterium]
MALSTTRRERGELTPERWQQISRIFTAAISLDDEDRAAFVAGECGIDQSLRSEVEKLIAAHGNASAEKFIGGMAAEAAAPLLIGDEILEPARKVLTQGQQFGSYEILEALGEGGMGEVYLARDTRLDRTVALKVLTFEISTDERRMKRFRQEAKVASSLNQPNILTVFEFGEVDGLTFLATEFVDGKTLRDYLKGKRHQLGEIIDIGIQILAALDAAHEAHIVHRDIKPENVMIRDRDQVVKVLDFGLAKVSATKQSEASEAATEFKTAPGTIIGTIRYLSPEQARGGAVDQRTDIWSTGVILYELVAGSTPFGGVTSSHTIVQILEKDPVPLSKLGNAPPELERIVQKAIAKSADERYQTAKDMLIDLRNLKKRMDVELEIQRTSSPTTTIDAVHTAELKPERSKKNVLAVAVIGMAIVTAAIFGISMWRAARTRSSVTPPAVLAPVSERTLTYWITVQKFRDKKPFQDPFTIPGEMIFEEDYQIRLSFSSPQAGHLYILNEGPVATTVPEFNVVFPSPTANKGTSSIAAGQVTQIPEQSWLKFDAQQGTEKLWLIFSEEVVPELESLKEFAGPATQGLVTDPVRNQVVQTFLNTHSETKPSVEKGEHLTTLKTPGNVLVHAIKLEHH